MSSRSLGLSPSLYDYLYGWQNEPSTLAALREETARMPGASMQISPEQGRFMGWLVALIGARRCLEIGVFTGYSSISVALALPDDGRLVACDVSEEWTAIARRYWERAGVAHKIELRLGPALDTLAALLAAGQAQSFDFAFIDADKEAYREYYERCLELLRPGGIIAVDNALWDGRVADPREDAPSTRAIRALNAFVAQDPRVDASLIPVGDGLLLARKR
ncbi:MAG: class I SAM-dependent methyltransferase [Pseudomonadota bacterium]|nr:MAG: SAM-dependent methyltransferase [Pseudomonadota bacterium]